MSNFNRKSLCVALSVFCVAAVSQSAFALTDTANLGVTADVTDNCTIDTSNVAFGNYDPIVANSSAALDGTGTVTVRCTLGDADPVITLDPGANAIGGTAAAPARNMLSGAATLSYTLYSEPTRTTVWGNTALSGLAYTGTGTAENRTVYGRIAGGQNVPAGNYSDTVVATVTF